MNNYYISKVYKNKAEVVSDLIRSTDLVLDVGFWGQGVKIDNNNWVHKLLLKHAKAVYGLDVNFDFKKITNINNYKKGNAENFDFNIKFDVIFASDLIEHLSNPGLFLKSCARNLKDDGKIIITTPNCFNLFSIAEKITKPEPTVNSDHTCYFNHKTLKCLLGKNNWQIKEINYLYSLDANFKESYKKKFLNIVYFILSRFTYKFMETLVVIAQRNHLKMQNFG